MQYHLAALLLRLVEKEAEAELDTARGTQQSYLSADFCLGYFHFHP